MTERPSCGCHGEPMLWQKDKRMTASGRWECRAKRRDYNRRRSAERTAWATAKYDSDPLYRSRKHVGTAKRKRRVTLAARKEQTPPNPQIATFLQAIRTRRGG